MAREQELPIHRRRGWWIRVARERQAMNVDDLAQLLGYVDGKGTISLWEKGKRPVPSGKFPQLAEVLKLPDRYLVNPPRTDEERLEEAIAAGSTREREDSGAEAEPDPGDDDEPDAWRRTRSA